MRDTNAARKHRLEEAERNAKSGYNISDCDLNIAKTSWTNRHTTRSRCFPEASKLDMLAVYTAYARRGHGTRLVKWSQDLAMSDGINQGVVTSIVASSQGRSSRPPWALRKSLLSMSTVTTKFPKAWS